MNESKSPILILAAKPENEIVVPPNFFDSTGPFFKLLQNPTYLRYSGWNLRTIDTPSIRDANAWKVENGDRKLIILYENLILLTAASLGPDFLGWGTKDDDGNSKIRVNSLALTEYAYEFARLFHEIIKNTITPITSVNLNITMMDLTESQKKIEIGQTLVGSGYITLPGNLITKDFSNPIEIKIEDYDPKKVAFRIVDIIFRHAGFPSDTKIPYTKDGEVDVDAILGSA